MKQIEHKVLELISLSREEAEGHIQIIDKMKRQDALIDTLKAMAQEKKTLLGRVIRFPHADSYAYYVIGKLNKTTVKVYWLDYCDGWQDERLGESGNLSLSFAKSHIEGRDNIENFFVNHNK